MLSQQTLQTLIDLGLRGMATTYRAQLSEPDVHHLSFDERLGLLVDREWSDRQARSLSRRLQEARLRLTSACPEDIIFDPVRGLDRALVRTLAEGRYLTEHQCVLITGPTGVGKSYLACALANAACRRGFSARYFRAANLVADLSLARADGSRPRLSAKLGRTDLLVIDDWGLSTLSLAESADLLDVIDQRCGNPSTLMASQLPVDRWRAVMADPTIADAVLDRLVHGAYHIQLQGESLRKVKAHPANPTESSPST